MIAITIVLVAVAAYGIGHTKASLDAGLERHQLAQAIDHLPVLERAEFLRRTTATYFSNEETAA
jgi:DNA-directed RNA polymerase specialized sigma24 family protein